MKLAYYLLGHYNHLIKKEVKISTVFVQKFLHLFFLENREFFFSSLRSIFPGEISARRRTQGGPRRHRKRTPSFATCW